LSEFFQELSEKLHKDGFEVSNFYLKHKKESFNKNGVSIYGENRGNLLSNYKAIYAIIKSTKPHVVISNFSYINPAILFGKLLGVSLNIAWFHTAFGHTQPNLFKIWNKSFYLRMADLVFTNSKILEREMHKVYKVSKDKTRRVPFWTNIANYSAENSDLNIKKEASVINIGCPGRLLENKNHKVVIKALYRLKQSTHQTINLYIVGGGTYKPQLEAVVADLDLQKEVIFLGVLSIYEMASFYQAMDIVVLPSFHEAFGLVFIEAIALGTPVLVSQTFGALSFIDNQKFPLEDFCFNSGDVQELIDKLIPYMKKQGLTRDFFKRLYDTTFKKQLIYNQIKTYLCANEY
jgi:glycosyltransferase involved in cell wall biosynthesis